MIRRAFLAIAVGLMGCGSGDDVKIDYTVSFTDVTGTSAGAVDSGSLTSIQSNVPSKALMGSSATFEVKSDMNGLHFAILEEGVRKGQITCTAQAGTGAVTGAAHVANGGRYLMSLNYKGARCIAVQ